MGGAEAGGADPIEGAGRSVLVVAPEGGGLTWALERYGAACHTTGLESASTVPLAAWSTLCGEPLTDLPGAADRVVAHLAGRSLAVDDAEWLAADEVDLLIEIVPRITVFVGCHVGTRRGRAVADRLATVLPMTTLAPVDPAVVEHVVRSRAPDSAADTLASVGARSGGLPGVARALASGGPLAAACVDRFRQLLAELGDDVVGWIRDVAVLPEGWPVADAGTPPADAIGGMLVGVDGHPAPLLVELVVVGLSPADVDDRRAAIAARCANPVRSARLQRIAGRSDASRATARRGLGDSTLSAADRARLAALAADSATERRDAVAALLACELASEVADLAPGTDDAVLDAAIARQLDRTDRADRIAAVPADSDETVRTREWLDASPMATSDGSPAVAHHTDDADDLDAARWTWQRSVALEVLGSARLDALTSPLPRPPPTEAWRTTSAQLAALADAHRTGPTDAVLEALAPIDVHPTLPRALVDAHRAVLLADLGQSIDAALLVAAGPRSPAPIDRALHRWATAEVELGAGHPLTALRVATESTDLHVPPAWFATLAGAWGAWEVGEALPQLAADPGSDTAAALFMLVEAELRALHTLVDGRADAADAFEAVAESWSGRHLRGELRARWAVGEAARRSGDRDRAVELLLALETRVESCAMAPLLQRVRRSLRLAGVQRRGARRANDGPLSAREIEVIELVGKGLATRDIALRLGLAESTIETQVTAAMHKLGARTRLQAATKYRELQR